MFIDGIGLSGYRSFGPDLPKIGPFRKVNLFIGQNNSGKSNILYFLRYHYRQTLVAIWNHNASLSFEPIDRPLGEASGKIVIALPLVLGGKSYGALLGQCKGRKDIALLLERVLKSKTLTQGTDVAWFQYEASWERGLTLSPLQTMMSSIRTEQVLDDHEWSRLWNTLTQQQRGTIKHWIPETFNWLTRNTRPEEPKITLIPAIRKVGEAGSVETEDYSGSGIIERLVKLKEPDYDQQPLKDLFEEINEFLRDVTGDRTALLEIPHHRKTIQVDMDGKILPLASLGMGIHEVIILASAATILRNQVICIEEPELHLHPLLQKKLVRYLQEKTDNQYFITTHSAHLLDTPATAVFHVKYQDGQSIVSAAHTDADKSVICADLGYRASDLLQANCIIWVEGPSDRIYLNHWIHAIDPSFVEGLHYSIMFYGGRLLSHLTANDPEVEDFISLRRLNRYIAIVIDSDRSKPRARINKTKIRVREEFDSGPGFAWITEGREIENYVEPRLLEEAVRRIHPRARGLVNTGQYDNCLKHYRMASKISESGADKLKVAREITNSPANLDILDLRWMVSKLVKFIRKTNDLNES